MILPIFINLILCFLIAALSGWVTRKNVKTWYPTLIKPSFNPPAWVFGPVWSVLYVMIAIVGGILWTQKSQHPAAFIFYVIQLVLNFSWSFVFFGARQIGWALVNIVLLWLSVLVTMVLAFQVSLLAGYLIIPYLLWLSIATTINASVWKLNRSR